ncbi:MAG: polyphosphate polymerase domain-containing protein [Myxococcales bacterium]|nr:polyphosphate polymerase domain-containing protein [Myxococcales bacterium]
MTTPTSLQRREYKYLIDEDQVDAIKKYIDGICAIDPYAVHTGGRYTIDTLYLDTPQLHTYRATLDQVADRYKLRIRTYPSMPGSPVFFEVKRRVNDTILKTRGHYRGTWQDILLGATPEVLDSVDAKQRKGIDNFLCYYYRAPMQPVAIVRYEREPYFSTIDDYARITFDRSVSYQRTHELSLEAPTDYWTYIDDAITQRGTRPASSAVLLELKFTSMVPGWMRNMVNTIGIQRLAYSKYGRAVDSLSFRPEPRIPRFGFSR